MILPPGSASLQNNAKIKCIPLVCINPGRASTGPDVLDTLKGKSDEKSILTRLDRLMDINTIKNFTFITFH